jgi:hypothetical protein
VPVRVGDGPVEGLLGDGLPEEAFDDLLLSRPLVPDRDDQAGGDVGLCVRVASIAVGLGGCERTVMLMDLCAR